ncbi:phospholipase A2 inhibitor and Ly6/PLAUR domain-containing protein-like isoform X1 [Notechis scutatus]|uniref:Phospholipase A2 inhibitor and Ly6/PLAUR domain-containing protein-like isoform X1 n=2 Tax=Notechis scutatus TaxID=8663 RepID=A0A6J1VUL8_9SAUR|nr:phospholipase A2 inhibitor and Ly6/PLAUR domain-containing protein-like isoform X1 [Notechis scutatus]XP_026546777.1 phospholipase A2 inhibitor and Ly6/PLAUR domain-containing protein-like isoform X1 [Notechis scutatus]XP_026546778.1 phospholipase A2 inhibitor and Ly6/PLAUR domain-containing protein-like isoform X1 [Notechis scutatus]XP_026546779.1 phospholipase A2 inhibitor and Ly6/PLAUR domain-containing protein-like isoform X1 [Notechis scutatus]
MLPSSSLEMKVLLSLFCISALLSSGAPQECEVCMATGYSCKSEKEKCEMEEDICFIELTETSKGGKNMSIIGKGCYFSENCTSASVLVTFGQGEFLRKSILCCSGEDCREDSLPWPPINMTANGKYCPACYSESEPCPVKTVECTGFENYCLDLAEHKYLGIEKLKGCTTESTCNTLHSGKTNLFDTDTVNCRPANQVSQLTGCLLFTLVAHLLMKVLF